MSFDPEEFFRNLERATQAQLGAAAQAAGEFAEVVMSESKEECPVSPTDPNHPLYIGTSGALRDSGTVGEVQVTADKISVEEGYNVDYAAAVHERLDANHQYEGRVNANAKAKFLEDPLKRNAPGFGPYVADAMKEAIGG